MRNFFFRVEGATMKRVLILAVAAILVLSVASVSEAACGGRLRSIRPVRGLLENKPVRSWWQNRRGAGDCGTAAHAPVGACNGTSCRGN
jgi:hypothetical protein